MEQRRYHSDPATGEFILMEWVQHGWHPAMQTMEDWQRGDARLYSPQDLQDTLVTMPTHNYWKRLTATEEAKIQVLIGRPWIQNSHVEKILKDDMIDAIDAATYTPLAPAKAAAAYPAHIIDAVLDHAETTQKLCPITMEPLQKATATLTRCGHIFQKAALKEWMKTHNTCPECRAAP